jgi:ribosome-associated heat shock protein Hsp15
MSCCVGEHRLASPRGAWLMSNVSPPTTGPGRLRLDKWLWRARFFKTRTLASRFIEGARLRIDGRVIDKAAATVAPGATLTFALHERIRVIRIVALGTRRGPSVEARALYEDLSPPVEGRGNTTMQ